MPYPNEHSCRLRDPKTMQENSFRRMERKHKGKVYYVTMARPKGKDKLVDQSYRYPKKTWSKNEAKQHCQDHGGSFEAARGSNAHQEILIEEAKRRRDSFMATRARRI